MLLLTRVRLIHWHFFHDITVELGKTTLLTGDNGSGKSTIIDAIQYALVANIAKIQFNAAAGQYRASRNLESYCRCKIGAEGVDFIRGDTMTHVILEFKENERSFLAGIMVESFTDADIKEWPWILEQGLLEDVELSRGTVLLPARAFREQIKGAGGVVCSTKREYNSRLTHLLHVHRRNMEFNPYLEALVRSVSFTPFTSINQFVCNYILEERFLDISAMKENLRNYKEAEKEARFMEEKITLLKEIEEGQAEVEQIQRQIVLQEYLKHRLNCEIIAIRILRNSQQAAGQEKAHKEIGDAIRDTNQRRTRLEELQQELTFALAENDQHRLFERLSREKNSLEQTLETARVRQERFTSIKAQCEALLGRALDGPLEEEIPALDKEREELSGKNFGVEERFKQLRSELADLGAEKRELEKGVLRYPESALNLKRALEQKGLACWFFADLLEVTDPQWQDAVEGWLSTQRFNILVAEDDFQRALEIYNSLSRKIAGVGLPNLRKMHSSQISPGSLAEVVEAASPLARRYCAYLLGDVIMTSLEHLKEYRKSITKECMRYASHTATRIKQEVYSRWYIGTAARERRLAQLKQRIRELEAGIESCFKEKKEIEQQADVLRRVYTWLHEIKEWENVADTVARLAKELKGLETEIAAIDTSGFEQLKTRIESVRRQIDQVQEELMELSHQQGKLENALAQLKVKDAELRHQEAGFSEERVRYEGEYPHLSLEFASYYKSRTGRNPTYETLTRVLANFEPAIRGMHTKRKNSGEKLLRLKHQYNIRYNTYMQEDGDESAQFLTTLQKYRDTELPSYKEKIQRAREEAEHQFREHFVARLNEYIGDAKESFSELNHTLKRIHFGQDQYRFTIEEKAEKKRVLQVIRDAARIRDFEGTIFQQLESDEERRSIEVLFQNILENDLDSQEVREICDYRQYFQYDIRIKHTQTTDQESGKPYESSLSKVLREKSGGETQTPYYVAIAASFYRFYKDDEHAMRLVLFDEAFNKMDDDRIGNMVGFFRKLGMQVLTAVPPEKTETIAPLVDRINVIMRKDHYAFLGPYGIKQQEALVP